MHIVDKACVLTTVLLVPCQGSQLLDDLPLIPVECSVLMSPLLVQYASIFKGGCFDVYTLIKLCTLHQLDICKEHIYKL